MTKPTFAVTPATFHKTITSFTVTNTTIAKILVETLPNAAAAGNLPLYYGGASLIAIDAASTDGSDKIIVLWDGIVLTTQGTTPTGVMATTATTNGTITRVNNSWITDGWKIGDTGMIFTPEGTAQVAVAIDGILFVVTAVTATTITVNGTPFAANATLTTGTRVIRVARRFQATIAANSGNSSTIPAITMLNNAMDGSVLRSNGYLGETNVLIAGLVASASALNAAISIATTYARY